MAADLGVALDLVVAVVGPPDHRDHLDEGALADALEQIEVGVHRRFGGPDLGAAQAIGSAASGATLGLSSPGAMCSDPPVSPAPPAPWPCPSPAS